MDPDCLVSTLANNVSNEPVIHSKLPSFSTLVYPLTTSYFFLYRFDLPLKHERSFQGKTYRQFINNLKFPYIISKHNNTHFKQAI